MIRDQIKKIVQDSLAKKGDQSWQLADFVLEHPQDKKFGDFSTNMAMRLAKQLKRKPLDIAQEISDEIQKSKGVSKFIEKIEVVAPGFINFFVAKDLLIEEMRGAQKENYGELSVGKGKKMIVEHTSVNPNKAMHVGHLRNMAIGDSLASLMKTVGYEVEIENYIDDTGVQVADVVLALRHFTDQPKPGQKFDHFCWDVYSRVQKEYEKNPGLLEERVKIQHQLEAGNNETATAAQELVEKIIGDHLITAGRMGVFYDVFIFESSILKAGLWEKTFASLKKSGKVVFEESGPNAGCWVFKNLVLSSEEKMKNPDKILVTSKGVAVYTAKDIAYHLWKFGQGPGDFQYRKVGTQTNGQELWASSEKGSKKKFGHADAVLNVIDVRQAYPQLVVKSALAELGLKKESENLKHVAYEVVSLSANTAKELGVELTEGKESYAMSGRKGIGVKADDLIDTLTAKILAKRKVDGGVQGEIEPEKIAAGAIKAYMLKQGLTQEVIFDLDQALSLTGDSGPYLQYTHARIKGILAKAEADSKKKKAPKSIPVTENEEINLLREIYIFPETVENAAGQLSPHLIYHYLLGLAQAFNSFYTQCPVLKAEPDVRAARLEMIASVANVLKKGLTLLGISAPDRM